MAEWLKTPVSLLNKILYFGVNFKICVSGIIIAENNLKLILFNLNSGRSITLI